MEPPKGLKTYLNRVRTAKRLRRNNPKLADHWRGEAYEELHDVLEVRELAVLLDGGYPDGVEEIDSLPGLARTKGQWRRSYSEVVQDVLERYLPPDTTDTTDAKKMQADMLAQLRKVNSR